MTNDERRSIYQKWFFLTQEANRLFAEKEAASALGDRLYKEFKDTDQVKNCLMKFHNGVV